jgi:hypothetical protein
LTGKPDALKGACPVWEGAVRNVLEGNARAAYFIPEKGQQYVQIVVSVRCNADKKSQCSVSPYSFKSFGSKGIMYDFAFISGVDGTLDSTDFFGGAKLESKSLFFLVGADETSVVLEFDSSLIFRKSAFFAIPDKSKQVGSGCAVLASELPLVGFSLV